VAVVWLYFFLLIPFGCSRSCAFSLSTFSSLSISLSIVCPFSWAISSHVALLSTLKASPLLLALFLFVFCYPSASFTPIQGVGPFPDHHCIYIYGIGIPLCYLVRSLFSLSILLGAQVITSTGSKAGEYEASPLYFFSCGSLPLINPYWQGVFLEYTGVYSFLQALFKHLNTSMCGLVPSCSGQ